MTESAVFDRQELHRQQEEARRSAIPSDPEDVEMSGTQDLSLRGGAGSVSSAGSDDGESEEAGVPMKTDEEFQQALGEFEAGLGAGRRIVAGASLLDDMHGLMMALRAEQVWIASLGQNLAEARKEEKKKKKEAERTERDEAEAAQRKFDAEKAAREKKDGRNRGPSVTPDTTAKGPRENTQTQSERPQTESEKAMPAAKHPRTAAEIREHFMEQRAALAESYRLERLRLTGREDITIPQTPEHIAATEQYDAKCKMTDLRQDEALAKVGDLDAMRRVMDYWNGHGGYGVESSPEKRAESAKRTLEERKRIKAYELELERGALARKLLPLIPAPPQGGWTFRAIDETLNQMTAACRQRNENDAAYLQEYTVFLQWAQREWEKYFASQPLRYGAPEGGWTDARIDERYQLLLSDFDKGFPESKRQRKKGGRTRVDLAEDRKKFLAELDRWQQLEKEKLAAAKEAADEAAKRVAEQKALMAAYKATQGARKKAAEAGPGPQSTGGAGSGGINSDHTRGGGTSGPTITGNPQTPERTKNRKRGSGGKSFNSTNTSGTKSSSLAGTDSTGRLSTPGKYSHYSLQTLVKMARETAQLDQRNAEMEDDSSSVFADFDIQEMRDQYENQKQRLVHRYDRQVAKLKRSHGGNPKHEGALNDEVQRLKRRYNEKLELLEAEFATYETRWSLRDDIERSRNSSASWRRSGPSTGHSGHDMTTFGAGNDDSHLQSEARFNPGIPTPSPPPLFSRSTPSTPQIRSSPYTPKAQRPSKEIAEILWRTGTTNVEVAQALLDKCNGDWRAVVEQIHDAESEEETVEVDIPECLTEEETLEFYRSVWNMAMVQKRDRRAALDKVKTDENEKQKALKTFHKLKLDHYRCFDFSPLSEFGRWNRDPTPAPANANTFQWIVHCPPNLRSPLLSPTILQEDSRQIFRNIVLEVIAACLNAERRSEELYAAWWVAAWLWLQGESADSLATLGQFQPDIIYTVPQMVGNMVFHGKELPKLWKHYTKEANKDAAKGYKPEDYGKSFENTVYMPKRRGQPGSCAKEMNSLPGMKKYIADYKIFPRKVSNRFPVPRCCCIANPCRLYQTKKSPLIVVSDTITCRLPRQQRNEIISNRKEFRDLKITSHSPFTFAVFESRRR
jgi:hypothetical protein